MTKVFTLSHVPDDLAQAWLQHLRDFDIAHNGRCRFEVLALAPDVSLDQMLDVLKVKPGFPHLTIKRKKKGP